MAMQLQPVVSLYFQHDGKHHQTFEINAYLNLTDERNCVFPHFYLFCDRLVFGAVHWSFLYLEWFAWLGVVAHTCNPRVKRLRQNHYQVHLVYSELCLNNQINAFFFYQNK